MDAWLKSFRNELKKHFYDDEINEILSYYEEMISERQTNGESITEILKDYDQKRIIKELTLETISKRKIDNYPVAIKSVKQFLIILLTTPLWIPIGVLYLSLLITMGALLISSVAIGIGAIAGSLGMLIESATSQGGWYVIVGLVGISFIVFSITMSIAYWLFRISYQLMIISLSFISKWLSKRGVKHESTI